MSIPASLPASPSELPKFITHTYRPSVNVHQARVYQQLTDNFCGYHAAFNTLCFLHKLQGGEGRFDILSGACFWSFKRRLEKFLFVVKEAYAFPDE